MSTQTRQNQEFPIPLRALFGLVAIATLFSNSPWAHADRFAALTAYAGSLMWGVLAIFGNKAGWPRALTMIAAIVYLALVASRLFGFAA
jgi:hypothetical protein